MIIEQTKEMLKLINPSLAGGAVRNHFEEFLKEPKVAKSLFWALSFNFFHNYKKKNFSCLSISCHNIWLEFYFGIKKVKIFKFYIPNINGPF
jgi:hypothetical protein